MTEYLLEFYVSGNEPGLAAEHGRNVRQAAEALTSRGTPVHYRRSMFVSDDETYFVVLEAESIDAVHEMERLARVSCDRLATVTHSNSFDNRESP